MSKITYRVVKHDGGWAFEANGTYSEQFQTREAARKAARLAATTGCGQRDHTALWLADWHAVRRNLGGD